MKSWEWRMWAYSTKADVLSLFGILNVGTLAAPDITNSSVEKEIFTIAANWIRQARWTCCWMTLCSASLQTTHTFRFTWTQRKPCAVSRPSMLIFIPPHSNLFFIPRIWCTYFFFFFEGKLLFERFALRKLQMPNQNNVPKCKKVAVVNLVNQFTQSKVAKCLKK